MTHYRYVVNVVPVVVMLSLSSADCANSAHTLERRQIAKMPQIRRDVRALDEHDREVIRVAREREEERRRIEREIHDREQRRLAEERRQERERRRAERELVCYLQVAGEDACQAMAREKYGDALASGGCSALIQGISSGSVDWGDVAVSVGTDAALKSDVWWIQLAGAYVKLMSLQKCMAGY